MHRFLEVRVSATQHVLGQRLHPRSPGGFVLLSASGTLTKDIIIRAVATGVIFGFFSHITAGWEAWKRRPQTFHLCIT